MKKSINLLTHESFCYITITNCRTTTTITTTTTIIT